MFRSLILLVLLMPWAAPLYAAPDLVSQGMAEYKDESFEEAAVTLERAYRQQPDNYEAVFYLGISYMQMLEFDKARVYLEKAAAMQPKDARLDVYLGEAFYNLHDYKSAGKVLGKAIARGVKSARAHYFLGLTRYRTGNYRQAVESFGQAMQMDEAMKIKVLYLMGMAHRKMGEQEASAAEFRQIKQLAPDSYQATQADAMLRQPLAPRENFHVKVTLGGQYDSNVVLKPASNVAGINVTRSRDYVSTAALNATFNQKVNDDIGVAASYGFSQSLHRKLTFFDVQTHHVDITPYLRLGKDQAILRLSADGIGVDSRRYMLSFGAMPGFVHDFGENQKGTTLVGYQRKLFFWQDANGSENRDANNYQVGYTHAWNAPQSGWLFGDLFQAKGANLSVSYVFDAEEAGGSNWSYYGHRATVSFSYPVWNRVQLSAVADQYRQIYRHINTFYNLRRNDVVTTLSPTLEWKPAKGGSLKLNYSYMRSISNLLVYDYRRSVFTVSFEGGF